jgi:hypothetical protein
MSRLDSDCRLMNFGGFATPQRRLLFDINPTSTAPRQLIDIAGRLAVAPRPRRAAE